jgi:lipid II:glycine glycyltransferase (peptidoglycan interpeptide bridge formation enzyme)
MNTKNIKQPEGGLLQSKEWMNVLRAEGKEIVAINNKIFGITNKLPVVGTYIYVPRACDMNSKNVDIFLQNTKNYNVGWIRIDLCDKKVLSIFDAQNIHYQKAPHDMQPKENFIIDITLSNDELLSQMKSKTRYNMRLAKKKGVEIIATREKKYIDIFCDLVEQTAKRKNVSFHNRKHYYEMFNNIPEKMMQLYVATYNDEVIATNIVSFYNDTSTYLHGATSDKYRNVMAPFLLQWQVILDAKQKGCKWYDFGGVFSDTDDDGKRGITRFKKSFSPKTEIFRTEGSYDIILSELKYKTYKILQKIKVN